LSDKDKVKKVANGALADFNTSNPQRKMGLVLFYTAIEHVVKIHRVITTEAGHALLIGVGGSGRKSLTELAVSMADTYELYQIEITSSYNETTWKDNMR